MSDDLEDGGSEDLDEIEFPTPEQKAFRKKVWAAIIVVAVVLSTFGIWFAIYRPWSIEDLDEKIVDRQGTPSFDPYLAGTSVHVGGKVTDFNTLMTTQGPLTLIELDDYGAIHLVDWEEPAFEVGDVISRLVHFEWGSYNNHQAVISPQADYPFLFTLLYNQLSRASYSFTEGLLLDQRPGASTDHIQLEVLLMWTDAFPLDMFNATLSKSMKGPIDDLYDFPGMDYKDNPVIDHIDSFVDGNGDNGTLRFVDANSNGLFDNGDFFDLNLSPLSEDNSISTYLLLINGGVFGLGVQTGSYTIALTNKGALQFWDIGYPNSWQIIQLDVFSESETSTGAVSKIVVTDSLGLSLSTQEVGCTLRTENLSVHCIIAADGDWECTEGYISVTFSDVNGDGFVNEGDIFTISNLSNWTGVSFEINRNYDPLGRIAWAVGLGVNSGNLPVIEWDDPRPLDAPINRIFMLRIDRMYGVPGVELGNLDERMVVNVAKDGSDIISQANLTPDFNFTSAAFNLTFIDADGNGHANTGDFFVCTSTDPSLLILSVGYVNFERGLYASYDQPLIFWSVSWQTG